MKSFDERRRFLLHKGEVKYSIHSFLSRSFVQKRKNHDISQVTIRRDIKFFGICKSFEFYSTRLCPLVNILFLFNISFFQYLSQLFNSMKLFLKIQNIFTKAFISIILSSFIENILRNTIWFVTNLIHSFLFDKFSNHISHRTKFCNFN